MRRGLLVNVIAWVAAFGGTVTYRSDGACQCSYISACRQIPDMRDLGGNVDFSRLDARHLAQGTGHRRRATGAMHATDGQIERYRRPSSSQRVITDCWWHDRRLFFARMMKCGIISLHVLFHTLSFLPKS